MTLVGLSVLTIVAVIMFALGNGGTKFTVAFVWGASALALYSCGVLR